jgi:pimeloyl-ACP methyl ester carboxylesterase
LGQVQAEQRPPLAAALVLVDIATRMEIGGAKRILEFMSQKPEGFASLEEAAEAIASYNPHRPKSRDLNGLKKNLRLHEDGRYRWHWDPAFVDGRLTPDSVNMLSSLDAAARGLSIPTLLVRGRMSDLLSREGADAFLAQVPHAHFVDVSGAGHMVAGDRNDQFTRAVLDFLAHEVREKTDPGH